MGKIQPVKRAILSVYNKERIEVLAKYLQQKGIQILSSGGTAGYLREKGIEVTEISKLTQFPEILEGRVKTLHPYIYGAILAKRTEKHLKELTQNNIEPVDLVVVNLYPFEKVRKNTKNPEVLIENIDIGGPTLIRAAAKNHPYVTVVIDPADYDLIIREMSEFQGILEETRRKLSLKAFAYTSYYDALIYKTFEGLYNSSMEYQKLTVPLKKKKDLRYGENPHQMASLYENPLKEDNLPLLVNCKQLWGKELSFNNYIDLDSALQMTLSFDQPFACILKHTNPCGAAIGDNIENAFDKAWSGDPKSAFGGIIGVNRPVSEALANKIVSSFFECVIAPSFEEKALEILQKKKNLRLLVWADQQVSTQLSREKEVKTISGGYLIQEMDRQFEPSIEWKLCSGKEYDDHEELDFAWKMVKFVKSNAIVLVKDKQLIGVGAGQMSRVDAVFMAIHKAKENHFELDGAILASDAFFPFADSIEVAEAEGIKVFIEPGGSIRDKEVIEKAKQLNVTLYFTGNRHFRH